MQQGGDTRFRASSMVRPSESIESRLDLTRDRWSAARQLVDTLTRWYWPFTKLSLADQGMEAYAPWALLLQAHTTMWLSLLLWTVEPTRYSLL